MEIENLNLKSTKPNHQVNFKKTFFETLEDTAKSMWAGALSGKALIFKSVVK